MNNLCRIKKSSQACVVENDAVKWASDLGKKNQENLTDKFKGKFGLLLCPEKNVLL